MKNIFLIIISILLSGVAVAQREVSYPNGRQNWGMQPGTVGCDPFINPHGKSEINAVSINDMTLEFYLNRNYTSDSYTCYEFDVNFIWNSPGSVCISDGGFYSDIKIPYKKYLKGPLHLDIEFTSTVMLGAITLGEIKCAFYDCEEGKQCEKVKVGGPWESESIKADVQEFKKKWDNWKSLVSVKSAVITHLEVNWGEVSTILLGYKKDLENNRIADLVKKAEQAYAGKNYDEAIKLYKEAGDNAKAAEITKMLTDKKKDEDFASVVSKGDELAKSGKYQEALAEYQKAKSLKPDDEKILAKINEMDAKGKSEKKANSNSEAVNNSSTGKETEKTTTVSNEGKNVKSPAEIQQEKQRQAEEDERERVRKVREKGQQTYDKSIEQSKNIEASKQEFVNSFNSSIGAAINNSMSYDSYSRALQSNNKLPNSKDPKVLLDAYEEQIKNMEKAFKKRKAELDAQMPDVAVNSSQPATIEQVEQSAKELGASIGNTMNQNDARKKYNRALEKLEDELEKAFDDIKADIINTNNQSYKYYSKQAVSCFSAEEENYSLSKAAFHKCIIDFTEVKFSHKNATWVNHNCTGPTTKTFNQNYQPTDRELYETALRKSKISKDGFNQAANDYIDMAINKNTKESDYYYLKSTLTDKLDVKVKCLQMALNLNPNNTIAKAALEKEQAKEEASYMKAKNSSLISDYEDYYKTYPDGKYVKETKSVLEREYFSMGETNFYKQGSEKNAKIYYNKYLEMFPNSDKAPKIKERLKKIDNIETQKDTKERDRLNGLADELKKESNRLSVRTVFLGAGIALIPVSVYLIISAGQEWQYQHSPTSLPYDAFKENVVREIGGGVCALTGILCIPFTINTSRTAKAKFRESQEYRDKARKISYNFSPAINSMNNSYGLALRVKF